MGRLFELVEEYRQRFEPHPPSYSRIAEQVGVSRQTLLNWQTPTKLIDKQHLVALADVTRLPYETVLAALIADIGYDKREGPSALSDRRAKITSTDLTGLPSVAHKPQKKRRDGS